MGQDTEMAMCILRREGINIFRKRGEKSEQQVKKKGKGKKKKDNMKEDIMYQVLVVKDS